MATGRELVLRAVREPMVERGWRARAAGWFTRPFGDVLTGVAVVSTSSEHYARSRAGAYAYVGLRDEAVESLVSQLSGHPDTGYRQRTINVIVTHLVPGQAFRQREVGEENAVEVGRELAAVVDELGLPFLARAAHDPVAFLDAFDRFSVVGSSVDDCRRAVVLATHGRVGAAWAFVEQQAATIVGRTDAHALDLGPALERVRAWLSGRG